MNTKIYVQRINRPNSNWYMVDGNMNRNFILKSFQECCDPQSVKITLDEAFQIRHALMRTEKYCRPVPIKKISRY